MKNLILILFIFLFVACQSELPPPTNDELTPPILKSLSENPAFAGKKQITLKGVSLQTRRNDSFLVFVDFEVDGARQNRRMIAQKYISNGSNYWQVIPATDENLKAVGLDKFQK